MILHYLKTALRNICKYKLQNVICILGLSLGFIALSLSAYWYWFENSYDKQYRDWERIYCVEGALQMNGFSSYSEESVNKILSNPKIETTALLYPLSYSNIVCDENFLRMFRIAEVKGNLNLARETNYGKVPVAISESKAKKLFGSSNPLGHILTYGDMKILTGIEYIGSEDTEIGYQVCAVFKDLNHSFLKSIVNTSADMLYIMNEPHRSMPALGPFDYRGPTVFIKLKPGTDATELREELASDLADDYTKLKNISKLHETFVKGPMDIRNIRVFVLASLLLMICAVTNCITMTVSRISGRKKEMGLRRSCGSSFGSLIVMLTTELGVLLLLSLSLSLIFVFWIREPFSDYAVIGGMSRRIVCGCVAVMASVFVISVAAGTIVMASVMKGSLNAVMTSSMTRSQRFRIGGLTVQLSVSMFCLLFTVMILRQLHFVSIQNWGFQIHDTVCLEMLSDEDVFLRKTMGNDTTGWDLEAIRQDITLSRKEFLNRAVRELSALPMVEYAGLSDVALVSTNGNPRIQFDLSVRYPNDTLSLKVTEIPFLDIRNQGLGVTVLEGSLTDELKPDEIVLTETVCKALALHDPIGKTVYNSMFPLNPNRKVVAVVSDFYLNGPMADPVPMVFNRVNGRNVTDNPMGRYAVIVKYAPGMRKACSEAIESLLADAPSDVRTTYMDNWMDDYMESSNALLRYMIAAVILCMTIVISGIYMVITLSCQERRREIAIRKVHGAKVRDVVRILYREYVIAMAAASVVALPLATVAVHLWQRQFAKQQTLAWWVYLAVLACMALLIVVTVGNRVLLTSSENPAEVIKAD